MPMFRYDGLDPVTDPGDSEIVRPGQVREMDQPPDWGPWTEIGEDGSEIHGEDGGAPELSQDAQEALAPAAPAPPPARPAKQTTPPAAGKEGA